MTLESLSYNSREAVWRAKKLALMALARVAGRGRTPTGSSNSRSITYSHVRLAAARDGLLLRDFEPISMLHADSTEIRMARFPVIDVHCHLNDGVVMTQPVNPQQFVHVMDETNVHTAISLTAGWGDKLRRSVSSLSAQFPGRFLVFCEINYTHLDEPNQLIETFDEARSLGAKGIKVLKDLGLTVRDRRGQLVRIDDPRLDPVWEKAGEWGMPVAIHTADPDAFFMRVDRHNERYQQLLVHPDWSYFGNGFPAKSELLAQRNHVFERHPGTRFWGLHVANHPECLDEVTEWMEQYPNLSVELGGRVAELGRQPRRAARFIRQFRHRIMFGSDAPLTVDGYRTTFRFLESEDEFFDYPGYPWLGQWKIYGLGLEEDILRNLYHENAARELGLPMLEVAPVSRVA